MFTDAKYQSIWIICHFRVIMDKLLKFDNIIFNINTKYFCLIQVEKIFEMCLYRFTAWKGLEFGPNLKKIPQNRIAYRWKAEVM